MRKIEHEMNQALHRFRNWSKDNTRVDFSGPHRHARVAASIYLFDNLIAEMLVDGTIEPYRKMFALYPTPTTASRLKALGIDAYIHNFKPMIDGEEVINDGTQV